jgi:hypothetical protein
MAFNIKDFTEKSAQSVMDTVDRLKVPPTGDGTGLPFSKVQNNRTGKNTRKEVHWFVPEFGIVKMFVNPEKIIYAHSKSISEIRTKAGYSLQYWGENLPKLSISGTTGSSGIEGINLLEEVYRAEQHALNAVNLNIASNNASYNIAKKAVDSAGSLIGSVTGIGSTVGNILANGLLGTDSLQADNLANRNLPTLASVAFAVEMYFDGKIHRGYFTSFSCTEDTSFIWNYNLEFTVTQTRGYRTNYFGFHNSANKGHRPLSSEDFTHSFYPNSKLITNKE